MISENQGKSIQATIQNILHQEFPSIKISVEDILLYVESGPHTGQTLEFNRELIIIGRGDWCDLSLDQDPEISKEHCEIQLGKNQIHVRDLGSRNGVYIDGVRVVEAFITPGSSLQIGQSRLTLQTQKRRKEIELHFSDSSQLMVGKSPKMRKLFAQIARLAPQNIPILLAGETGTGKTTVARGLHQQSLRKEGPLVVVNCGAISPSLIESLFFGYEKGAFTGADKQYRGYFEQAHKGTLFLDELGELSPSLQPKLLDVLERQQIQRLGNEKELSVDVRIIASTHRNLAREVAEGRFRRDLYYRLAVVEIEIPPLRQRTEDIPLLTAHTLSEIDPKGKYVLTGRAIQLLQEYLWPGNVRQLHNVLRRAVALADGENNETDQIYIDSDALYLAPVEASSPQANEEVIQNVLSPDVEVSLYTAEGKNLALKELLEKTEQQAIESVLSNTKWNISESAEILSISRAWLHRRIKKYNLVPPKDFRKKR